MEKGFKYPKGSKIDINNFKNSRLEGITLAVRISFEIFDKSKLKISWSVSLIHLRPRTFSNAKLLPPAPNKLFSSLVAKPKCLRTVEELLAQRCNSKPAWVLIILQCLTTSSNSSSDSQLSIMSSM